METLPLSDRLLVSAPTISLGTALNIDSIHNPIKSYARLSLWRSAGVATRESDCYICGLRHLRYRAL
jgi:hypothetical protein